ncbi:MAG: leucine-rich repeat domain-containing protein, partial [Oscillospiraceae bacterium]|nr:leucine-rich repeat domain-containing protein [Oscillospiraceae bacterium]
MRKLKTLLMLLFTLGLAVLLSTAALAANTTSGTCGDNLTWVLDRDTGVLTISGTGEMTDYSFFSYDAATEEGGHTIGCGSTAPFFNYGRIPITSIIIESGVTSIGEAAFVECSSLTSIAIPDSVASIGDDTFCGCSSLMSITIPDGVTSIGYAAFGYCSSLTNVTILDSVTSIGSSAFRNCSSLTDVYYGGNEEEWYEIRIGFYNECLESATIHCARHVAGNPVIENKIAATCTESGFYESVAYCSFCGIEISRETITVPATGHTTLTDTAVVPTCTETGLTEGSHCSACGEVFVAQEVIPAIGHTSATDAAVAATCTETGLTEGS